MPTNVRALVLLARALGVRGHLTEGQKVLARALSENPADGEAVELMATFRQAAAAGIH